MSSVAELFQSRRFWIVLLVFTALTWGALSFFGAPDPGPVRNSPFPEKAQTSVLEEAEPGQRYWAYGLGAPNFLDGRAYLFDMDAQRLGQLSTGQWHTNLVMADRRSEVLSIETYFSRGTRGERTDIVVAYDVKTLTPKYEIKLPPKRMTTANARQLVRMTPDQRFMVVVNYTPAQSLTIVDLEKSAVVEEVETPGCMGAHEGGQRSFYLICSNGSFLHLRLGPDGAVAERRRTKPLFDAIGDALSTSPSKIGGVWYFLSRQANIYAFRMTDETIERIARWSALSDGERADDWTIAGFGHTAAHGATGRIFALFRQGEQDKFENPGEEVWVFDAATRKRVQRITMEDLTVSIDVTQTADPKLLTMDLHIPVSTLETIRIFMSEGETGFEHLLQSRVNIYDATSGEHLKRGPINPGGGFLTVQAW